MEIKNIINKQNRYKELLKKYSFADDDFLEFLELAEFMYKLHVIDRRVQSSEACYENAFDMILFSITQLQENGGDIK